MSSPKAAHGAGGQVGWLVHRKKLEHAEEEGEKRAQSFLPGGAAGVPAFNALPITDSAGNTVSETDSEKWVLNHHAHAKYNDLKERIKAFKQTLKTSPHLEGTAADRELYFQSES